MRKNVLFIGVLAFIGVFGTSCNEPTAAGQAPEDKPDWYYTGGKLGTTTNLTSMTFRQPTPSVDDDGTGTKFAQGDQIAEKDFVTNTEGRQHGLGPVYVRSSCQHCHPNYSHGVSVPEGKYDAAHVGNGTLLVLYDPATDAYVSWVAGMPQLFGAAPFKAPIDPNQITVTWKTVQDEHGNKFEDGETYELRYPDVTIPTTALYSAQAQFRAALEALPAKEAGSDITKDIALLDGGYEVRLENTIGVYGTGLLDAIPDQDIIDQYAKEAADGKLKHGLNPAFWDGSFKTGGYYKNDPQWGPKRFTYALTRGPIMDAAGANAIWNITNVTRSDRQYHYLDLDGRVYATCASIDPDVQAGFADFIQQQDPNGEHPEWSTGDVQKDIYTYLTSKTLPAEMSDDEFTQVMIWHRGLAVPAARNVTDPKVLRGKELFTQIGCDYCHRPTWTTGPDEVRDPNNFKGFTAQMPRYQNQKIWPYTDMVQHKLCMENDIRTGWCRTTPLWGRGLHRKATGDAYEARMHDTRARNVIEAIMWHGYSSESDAYYPTQQFYKLNKEDRDAIVAFINAI